MIESHDGRVIERMRKILALARRGVGGEKETAESMLTRMLTKYGMTVEDLDPELQPTQRYKFSYTNEMEKRLLKQIISKVLNVRELTYWRVPGTRKIELDLTKAQYAELDLSYNLYRKALKKEVNRLFSAFVQTNRIFSDLPSEDDGPDMSLEELEALLNMMRGMTPTPICKLIAA